MPLLSVEIILVASVTGGLMLLLLGLIAGLSIVRQQRHRSAQRAETRAAHLPDLTVALSQLTPAGTAETLVRRPRLVESKKNQKIIIAERYRLPVREADPDEVVIRIEPDLVSPDQQNVQRLIDYLKTEIERANQAS
jgi:hypothetical protein